MRALEITAVRPDPALLDLPWDQPLAEWPEEILAALPRGISRHVVRFVRVSGRILAVKEIDHALAQREYSLLRMLERIGEPVVEPFGVVGNRQDADGNPLDAVLITRHLHFSLPYRAVFGQISREATANRLIDALAVLMVRLHLAGFYWGDISLSNTLFRRDAGSFAAYLVDVETGVLHGELSEGQRLYDLDLARTNIIGELMDLQAGGIIDEDTDVIAIGDRLEERYRGLWSALTQEESFDARDRWRVAERIEQLNAIGFDVEELEISTDHDTATLSMRPKVVDAGHHARRLLRLTGIDAQENQARRLLNDLDQFRAVRHAAAAGFDPLGDEDDEELIAHAWKQQVYDPVVRAIPHRLRSKLQPPQYFHEILEHKWFMSERAGRDVSFDEAVQDYVLSVLPNRRDERALVVTETSALPIVEPDD